MGRVGVGIAPTTARAVQVALPPEAVRLPALSFLVKFNALLEGGGVGRSSLSGTEHLLSEKSVVGIPSALRPSSSAVPVSQEQGASESNVPLPARRAFPQDPLASKTLTFNGVVVKLADDDPWSPLSQLDAMAISKAGEMQLPSDVISQAAREMRKMVMVYTALRHPVRSRTYTVSPYSYRTSKGNQYLYAFDHDDRSIKAFRLEGINRVQLLNRKFKPRFPIEIS